MLPARSCRDRGAAPTADQGADRRSRASAGDPTDHRARTGADARSRERPLAFTAALRFSNGSHYRVFFTAKRNRIHLQIDLITAADPACFLNPYRTQLHGCSAGNQDDTEVVRERVRQRSCEFGTRPSRLDGDRIDRSNSDRGPGRNRCHVMGLCTARIEGRAGYKRDAETEFRHIPFLIIGMIEARRRSQFAAIHGIADPG